jgi:hypothetical protein
MIKLNYLDQFSKFYEKLGIYPEKFLNCIDNISFASIYTMGYGE